jgi:hypothetical protein
MRSACLLALAALLAAAEPTISVSAVPASVAVGEAVTVTITYRWDAEWSPVTPPDPMPALTGLFLTSAPPPERRSDACTVRVVIAAERSGAWELPQISAAFRAGDGSERLVTAPTVTVQVGTEAAPPALPDPLPALTRPTAGAERDQRWWWIGGGIAAAAGLLAVALWRRRTVTGPTIDPHEHCRVSLDAAAALADGKEAAAALGLALRTWIGALHRFDGAGATVREVAAMLRARPACPAEEARVLLRLLERLDEGRWSYGPLPLTVVSPQADEARLFVAGVAARMAQEAAAAAKVKP